MYLFTNPAVLVDFLSTDWEALCSCTLLGLDNIRHRSVKYNLKSKQFDPKEAFLCQFEVKSMAIL